MRNSLWAASACLFFACLDPPRRAGGATPAEGETPPVSRGELHAVQGAPPLPGPGCPRPAPSRVPLPPGTRGVPRVSSDGWVLESPTPDLEDRRALWVASASERWTASLHSSRLEHWHRGTSILYDVGFQVEAIWGTSPTNVWAVGDKVVHWNGQNWAVVHQPPQHLMSVYGLSADQVWAAGLGGTLLAWDGCAWRQQRSGTTTNLLELWASADNDLWVIDNDLGTVGQSTVRRWNGSYWSVQRRGTFYSLWGSGPTDVWLGGMADDDQTSLQHFDGSGWREVKHPRGINGVYALWGSDARHVYAGTHEGSVLVWNGESWSQVFDVPDPSLEQARLFRLSGAEGRVWAAGDTGVLVEGTPAGWSLATPRGELTPVGAGVGNELGEQWWSQGSHLHHQLDGESSTFDLPAESRVPALARAGADVWAATEQGQLWRYRAGVWEALHDARDDSPEALLTDASASAEDNVWSVGFSEDEFGRTRPLVLHFDGSTWAPVPVDRGSRIWSVLTFGPQDTWVGTDRQLGHWNGASWEWFDAPEAGPLRGLWGTSSRELWAAGLGAWRFHQGTWHRLGGPDDTFFGARVWGRGASQVFFVGDYGEAREWNGASLATVELPLQGHLLGVFGAGNETFIVGALGARMRKRHPATP